MTESPGDDGSPDAARPSDSIPDGDAVDRDSTALAGRLLEGVRREEPVADVIEMLATCTDAELEPIRTDRRAALAFWLNCYNAATQLLLERRPALFDSRVRFFRAPAITVAGTALSLDDVEHGILRGRRSKYGLGYLPRLSRTGLGAAYRLEPDPRIHFALNCGAASCPAILAYEPEPIDEILDEATRTSLERSVEYDPERDRLRLPRVCLWFLGDFGGPSGLRSFLRTHGVVPESASTPSLRFRGYDWSARPRAFASSRE